MVKNAVKIKHFRNYQAAEVDLILAYHLRGKCTGETNILVFIYFLALTELTEPRTGIRIWFISKKKSSNFGNYWKTAGKIPLDIELTPKGRITKINHLKQGKLSDYIGASQCLYLLQEDLQLIEGSAFTQKIYWYWVWANQAHLSCWLI